MNAPLQLSDSVNIKKKGANVCNMKKKSTDVRIISAWGLVSKRTVAPQKSSNIYSFYTLKFFCIHVEGHTHKKNHKIFPYDDHWISR